MGILWIFGSKIEIPIGTKIGYGLYIGDGELIVINDYG